MSVHHGVCYLVNANRVDAVVLLLLLVISFTLILFDVASSTIYIDPYLHYIFSEAQ
jgi:hypothetical protein